MDGWQKQVITNKLLFILIIILILTSLLYNSDFLLGLIQSRNPTQKYPTSVAADFLDSKKEENISMNILNDTSVTLNQLIDLKNFSFVINSPICNETCKSGFFVIFVIHSDPNNNLDKRDAIRNTWGQQRECIKFIYAMGDTNNEKDNIKIQEENKKHNDIIQGNFLDTYWNLTYKHVMVLKWATSYCKQAKYLVKTDDDLIVNTDVLYDKLKNNVWSSTNLISCRVFYNGRPQRPGYGLKWAVTKEEYPEDFYPDFCQGHFIIYSPDVAYRLLEESEKFPYFRLDDVHVSGILAKKINIKQIDVEKLRSPSAFYISNNPKNYIYGPQQLQAQDIYNIWKSMKKQLNR